MIDLPQDSLIYRNSKLFLPLQEHFRGAPKVPSLQQNYY